MKNILKTIFMAVMCVITATSCDDKVGVADAGPVGNPEKEIAGTYTGVWSKTLNDDTQTAPGTITFTAGDRNYVANINVSCPEFDVNLSGTCNVVNNSVGYVFYNQEAKNNGFGTPYTGRVVNGNASIKFTLTVKDGRKQNNYVFEFATE